MLAGFEQRAILAAVMELHRAHLEFKTAPSAGVGIPQRRAHSLNRNRRYDTCEKEPGDTNPDCEDACERLPRCKIAITNRESGDEGEIHCVPNRPALDKGNQQAQGNLDRQNCRQDWPCYMDGVAEGHVKAPPHGSWCRPVHVCFFGREGSKFGKSAMVSGRRSRSLGYFYGLTTITCIIPLSSCFTTWQ